MKKTLCIFVILITFLLSVSCGVSNGVGKIYGRWEATEVELDGSRFTMEEIQAMGDHTMDDLYIVIKEGGKAYAHLGEEGLLVDWEETETGVKIGQSELTHDGRNLVLEKNGKIFFEKVSDDQTITAYQNSSANNDSNDDPSLSNQKSTTESITDSVTEKADKSADLIGNVADASGNGKGFDPSFTLKTSSDKHIQYINNYVGRNAASFGYTSLGGYRMDTLGSGLIRLVLVSDDGSYVDISDEESLKHYTVTGQSVEPNTEVRIEFQKDSDGNEYSSLTEHMSVEQVDLSVSRIGESNDPVKLTEINPSPDKYTCYVRDYVGRNLANIGYTSLGEDRRDQYGQGNIELLIVADDGSYVDPTDEEALKQYYVTEQDVAPNTEFKYEFSKDSNGEEFGFVDDQTLKSITLYVSKIS